jgi:RimJ/RimL family protein N-acetyltransferase
MDDREILLLVPSECSDVQLVDFHDLVVSGGQVKPEGLAGRIANAAILAFAYIGDQLAGVASIKKQKQSYITGIFLKAKIPRQAIHYQYEIGYAVTHPNFRKLGLSREMITALMAREINTSFYATSKNEYMCDLLLKIGFKKAGLNWKNSDGEELKLFVSGEFDQR